MSTPNSPAPRPATGFRPGPLDALLLAVPVAIALEVWHAPPVWVFLTSALAIVPLAGLMGRATEELAETLGAGAGGLLNATFGNAAELILALMALRQGESMYPLVKASLTGSIIGNILLVVGLAALVGGIRHPRQVFNRTAAGMGSTLLALACIGLIVPTLFFYLSQSAPDAGESAGLASLSEEIAGVLAVAYLLNLLFSLRTHAYLYEGGGADSAPAEPHTPGWGRPTAVVVLLVATAAVAVMSEFLVGSVEPAAAALGMKPVFVGVIVVAVIGNAAEHSTAVLMAWKNKMDLAIHVAIGSSIQIALFVAPILVFASMVLGHGQPLDLHFTRLEVVAVVASVGILALVTQDGESNWLEGALLLAVYLIFALAFYHLPRGA